jgi:hypothetical protein
VMVEYGIKVIRPELMVTVTEGDPIPLRYRIQGALWSFALSAPMRLIIPVVVGTSAGLAVKLLLTLLVGGKP